jgi:IBR domain, a half RING-finger domain
LRIKSLLTKPSDQFVWQRVNANSTIAWFASDYLLPHWLFSIGIKLFRHPEATMTFCWGRDLALSITRLRVYWFRLQKQTCGNPECCACCLPSLFDFVLSALFQYLVKGTLEHAGLTCGAYASQLASTNPDGTVLLEEWQERAGAQRCQRCNAAIEKNEGCKHMTCRCGYEFCWACGQEWTHNHLATVCHRPAPPESGTTTATVHNENEERLRNRNRPDPNAPNGTVIREDELTRRTDFVAHSQVTANDLESARGLREHELRLRTVQRLRAQDPVAARAHESMEEDVPSSRMFALSRVLDGVEDEARMNGIGIQDDIAPEALFRSRSKRRSSSRREKRTSSRTRRARGRPADASNPSNWACCFQF